MDSPSALPESLTSWLEEIKTILIKEDPFQKAIRFVDAAISRSATLDQYLHDNSDDWMDDQADHIYQFCLDLSSLLKAALKLKEEIRRYVQSHTKLSSAPEHWLIPFLACSVESVPPGTTQSLGHGFIQSVLPNATLISVGDIQSCLQEFPSAPNSLEDVLERSLRRKIESNKIPKIENPIAVLVEDFKRSFEGNSARHLHDKLKTLSQEDTNLYAEVLPIIQSSGVGKSRTVVELSSKYAPGVIFCIREVKEGSTSSLPLQDSSIFEFLSTPPTKTAEGTNESREEWWHHCLVASLIIATLDVFETVITTLLAKEQIIEPTKISNEQRKRILTRFSHIFVDNIVEGYRSNPGSPDKDHHALDSPSDISHSASSTQSKASHPNKNLSSRPEIIKEVARLAKVNLKKLDLEENRIQATQDAVKFRSDIADNLGGAIKDSLGNLRPIFDYYFIALDEFSKFSHLLGPLRRLFSEFKGSRLRALILDTNNKLADVAGSVAASASDRSRDRSLRLLSPHLVISHDIELFRAANKTLYYDFILGRRHFEHAQLLDFLPRMGRPLWADKNMQGGAGSSQDALISFSRVLMKMLAGAGGDLQESDIIALAASRLPLNLLGVQGWASSSLFLQTQISLHLRCINAFDPLGDLVHSWTPSEPIMSLAAADYQRRPPSLRGGARNIGSDGIDAAAAYWSQAITAIRNKQATGCLIVGENGEEFSRISMTVAMDLVAAAEIPPSTDDKRLPAHLTMINLYEWFSRLYGDIRLPAVYLKLFKESWVNFTHFIRFGEKYTQVDPFRRHHLLQLWSRQAVGIGISNQADWDKIVPFYRGGTTKPSLRDTFDPSSLHYLLIQDKNDPTYSRTSQKWRAKDTQKTIDIKPSDANEHCESNPDVFLFVALASPTATVFEEDDEHKTLRIYLGGSDAARYPFMREWKPEVMEAMIGLLGPHVSAIRRPQQPTVGTQEWREMHWKMATQGMLSEKEPPLTKSEKTQKDQVTEYDSTTDMVDTADSGDGKAVIDSESTLSGQKRKSRTEMSSSSARSRADKIARLPSGNSKAGLATNRLPNATSRHN